MCAHGAHERRARFSSQMGVHNSNKAEAGSSILILLRRESDFINSTSTPDSPLLSCTCVAPLFNPEIFFFSFIFACVACSN